MCLVISGWGLVHSHICETWSHLRVSPVRASQLWHAGLAHRVRRHRPPLQLLQQALDQAGRAQWLVLWSCGSGGRDCSITGQNLWLFWQHFDVWYRALGWTSKNWRCEVFSLEYSRFEILLFKTEVMRSVFLVAFTGAPESRSTHKAEARAQLSESTATGLNLGFWIKLYFFHFLCRRHQLKMKTWRVPLMAKLVISTSMEERRSRRREVLSWKWSRSRRWTFIKIISLLLPRDG